MPHLLLSRLSLLLSVAFAAGIHISAEASATSSAASSNTLPILPHKALHATASKAEIFQYDSSPLGGRRVLLLIHGGGAEKRKDFRWTRLLKTFSANEEIASRFKIYLYRYNSDERLSITAPQLRESILKLKEQTGAKQISLLCLSMGGNLAQQAMLYNDVEATVHSVFCMATPFHGSPLFSPGWFQYSLDKPWYMPWARPVHNLDYLLYFSRHKSLQDDLRWDDFDNMIPDVGKFKSPIAIGPSGVLTQKADANPQLATINENPRINKGKFIAYGGYLVNSYLLTGKRKLMEETVLSPWHYVTVKLPVQLGREHPALRLLNFEMCNMKMNTDAAHPNPHSYELNDGITPVSSAVYLPPEFMRKNPMLLEDTLKSIPAESDVRLARVFRDMDHISFLDGKPPKHTGQMNLVDQAHPEQGQRMLFDWLIKDLLEYGTSNTDETVMKTQK